MQSMQVAQRGRRETDVEYAIVAHDVTKSYGQIRALDGLSFAVERGEIFALLGPNGAGKTTLVEMLEGYRKPDAGTVRVLGFDPIAEGSELKQQVGLMLQQTAPAAMREELGLEPGHVLVGHVENGRLVLESRDAVLRRVQARFRAAVPRDVSLADELIAERHHH